MKGESVSESRLTLDATRLIAPVRTVSHDLSLISYVPFLGDFVSATSLMYDSERG